ncbi:TPA: LPXTG cell wall anchor domain-containing protein, partial [Streptococcus suis]|nr:LPXTG cell wall anchor domain-containing protein [Streptococcus suis]
TIDVIKGEDGIPVIIAKGEPAYHELPTIDISSLGLTPEEVPAEEVPTTEIPTTEVPVKEVPNTVGKTPVVTVDYAPTFETSNELTPKVVNHSSELKQSTDDSVKILPNTGETKTNLSYLGLGILGLGALAKRRKKYR